MIIYFRSIASRDNQSHLYRDAFAVYQKAIWTIFSERPSAPIDGFGMEVIDETFPVASPRSAYSGITYAAVSYTHLDVYKRQDVGNNNLAD